MSAYMNSYKEEGAALSWVVKTESDGIKQCVTGLWLSKDSVTGLTISYIYHVFVSVFSLFIAQEILNTPYVGFS